MIQKGVNKIKNTKNFYNRTAKQWAEKWYEDDTMQPYLNEFFNYIPENPQVLDLCCGTGYESMRLKKLGAVVTGIDFSEESIQIARKRNPDIRFVVEDMLNDYSYLGKFDGCAVIAGLVHLPENKLKESFKRIHKVLHDNGYLFVVVKDGIGKSEESSFKTIDGEAYDRDFYLHTIEELKQSSIDTFSFVKEILINDESPWKYYIFKKENY